MEWKRALTEGRRPYWCLHRTLRLSCLRLLSISLASSSVCSLRPTSLSLLALDSGGFGGANDRKEALKGDQELDELLFIRKRPLLAMRPAGSGGEGQRLSCPVEVKVRRDRVVYREGGDEGGGRSGERAQAGAAAGLG